MKKVICLSEDLIKVLKPSPAFKSNPTNNYELDIFFFNNSFFLFPEKCCVGIYTYYPKYREIYFLVSQFEFYSKRWTTKSSN